MKDKAARFIPVIAILLVILYLSTLYNKANSKDDNKTVKEESTDIDVSDSYNSSSTTSYEKSKICSWCSKSFTGIHYTHLGRMSDCNSTSDENSIGKYCSMQCCSESRKRSCPTCP